MFCKIFIEEKIIYNRVNGRSPMYFILLKSEIVSTKLNSVKYINNDTMHDKHAFVRLRFVTRVMDVKHRTGVNRDTDDILQPSPKLLRKMKQTKIYKDDFRQLHKDHT